MKALLDDFDLIADRAGKRHMSVIGTFDNERKRAMTGAKAFSRSGVSGLTRSLTSLAWTYIENETDRIHDAVSEISQDATRRALEHLSVNVSKTSQDELSGLFSETEDASVKYLTSELVAQVNRDVNQIIKGYRNAALRAVMKADIDGISREAANMQTMIDETISNQKVWFFDSVGRKLPSQKHIRRTWRMALRDHWVQIYTRTLTAFSVSKAVVWHPDSSHKFHGEPLQLTEVDFGLSNFDQVFHPNARVLPVTDNYMKDFAP